MIYDAVTEIGLWKLLGLPKIAPKKRGHNLPHVVPTLVTPSLQVHVKLPSFDVGAISVVGTVISLVHTFESFDVKCSE